MILFIALIVIFAVAALYAKATEDPIVDPTALPEWCPPAGFECGGNAEDL